MRVRNQITTINDKHWVKSVQIRSFPGPYFPSFGLNTVGYFVSLRIQSENGKIRTRKTPNKDTFYAVRVRGVIHIILERHSISRLFLATSSLTFRQL